MSSYMEKKLEKAEAVAEELWHKEYDTPEGAVKPAETATPVPETVAEEVAEVVPEVPVETPAPEGEAVAEKPTEVPVAEVAVEPEKPEKVKSDDFKQKYQTLEGKYKAEVPRLSAEIGQWKDYATSLQERITTLETAAKKPVKIDEPVTDPDIEAVTTTYPEVAAIIKKMKEEHKAEIQTLRTEMETGVTAEIKNLKNETVLSKQDRFDMAMRTAGVPDWKVIDKDPAFIEWLGEQVPYTRATKLQLLQQAAREFDAETTSRFFLDFKEAIKEPDGNVEPPPDKLSKFTAPPRGEGVPPVKPVPAGVTKAQYEKFMNPRYKFKPADWGGKTSEQMDVIFDNAIQKGTLF
jgi:hypothetical protein